MRHSRWPQEAIFHNLYARSEMRDIESSALSGPIAALGPFPVDLALTPSLTALGAGLLQLWRYAILKEQGSNRKSIERMSGSGPWRRLGDGLHEGSRVTSYFHRYNIRRGNSSPSMERQAGRCSTRTR